MNDRRPGAAAEGGRGRSRLPRMADAGGVLAFVIGLLAAIGWLLDVDSLKRVLPGLVALKFNTAVGFMLAGAALWWRGRPPVRLALGMLVALVGALTLSEYVARVSLGIDQLFIRDSATGPDAGYAPGRMAPSTALCFLLIGAALMLCRQRRPRVAAIGPRAAGQAAELLALTVAVIGGFSLVAYPTGAVYLRQLPGFVGVALNTAVAMLALGLGTVVAADGFVVTSMRSRGTGRLLWIGFAALSGLLSAIGVVFAVHIQALADDLNLQADVARPRREVTLELENGVLGYELATRLAIAGDAQASRAAADDARDLEHHLADYTALADTDRQRALAMRFAARWQEVRAAGEALLTGKSPPSRDEQARFIALVVQLEKLLDDEMRVEAVETFEARRALTMRDLERSGDLPLGLLVVCVVLALVTGGVVARAASRSEQTVRESEERYRSIVETAAEGIATYLPDGTITFSNRRMADMLGSSREEIVGRSSFDLVDDDEKQAWAEARATQAEHGSSFSEERKLRCKDGSTVWTLANVTPQRDEAGNLQSYLAMHTDITERHLAEEKLREANRQLAEADRRKTEFLAVLSHELRNPLAPISNSLFVLEHAEPGGEQASRAQQVIGRQVGYLSNLVNELLEITRITRGKIQLQKERLDLSEVVGRTVDDNRSIFERAGVRLERTLTSKPVHVLADRTRVAQIVGNLLQNAAKFTSKGGCARVSVAAEGGEAVIRVADDGVGIGDETLSRLFEPFMQAEQTLDRSKGGLGLGLALVKGLVELHGGSVSAHSDGLGKGAELVVRLPLDRHTAAELTSPRPPSAGARRRILIIEDNADAADSLREALEMGEHEVAVAYNGPDGLARAHEFRPEVVLCDIGLPSMDGYAVARAFRADDMLRSACLVALTGYALPEDLERATEAGFDRHLAKPPNLEKLEHLLAEILPPRDAEATAVAQRRATPGA